MNKRGMTLIELTLTIVLASGILAAIIILFMPFVKELNEAFNFQRLRHKISNPLDALRVELANAKAIYFDSNQCFAFCSIDRNSGNRIIYYWSGSDLLRKPETPTTAVACTNGKAFATSMDKVNSSISQSGGLVTVKLAATGTNSTSYSAQTTVFPTMAERQTLFYDGFNCNTDSGYGWTLEDTGTISWKIGQATGSSNYYWLKETLKTNQGSPLTASATVAVDLSRANQAYLQFKYRTIGTMNAGEIFTVNFYDGTWHEVFRDDLLGSISSLATTTVDLSAFTLASNNQIRFDGLLSRSNDHWVIDEIEVIAK